MDKVKPADVTAKTLGLSLHLFYILLVHPSTQHSFEIFTVYEATSLTRLTVE